MKKITLICRQCGVPFETEAHRSKAKFCSVSCGTKFRHAEKRVQALNPINKVCSRCLVEQPRTNFYARPEMPDGLRADCKSCFGIVTKTRLSDPRKAEEKRLADHAYYEREAERITREARERYADPIEGQKIRAWNKASRERHADKHRARGRRRRVVKGDIVRAARRRHYRENKAKYKAASVARTKHVK